MKTELEKLRTRWLRWLGQKTRCDKPYWTTLLESNWKGWATKVLDRPSINMSKYLSIEASRTDVQYYYGIAIHEANMKELMQLDELYCADIISKMNAASE